MKCFRHHDRDAFGMCKSCGKGLCDECLVDLGHGLACKGHCEEAVLSRIEMAHNNAHLIPTTRSLVKLSRDSGISSAVLFFIFGAVMIPLGLYNSGMYLVGGLFIVYGCIAMARVLKVEQPPPETFTMPTHLEYRPLKTFAPSPHASAHTPVHGHSMAHATFHPHNQEPSSGHSPEHPEHPEHPPLAAAGGPAVPHPPAIPPVSPAHAPIHGVLPPKDQPHH